MKRISSVYFFPFLNTYKFQYLGRLGGKNSFKMYLTFSNSSFPRFLSFTRERRFFRIWREGTCYLLSKDSFRSSPEFRRQFQPVSLRQLLSKNWEILSLFPLTKRALLPVLRLLPIIWLLPPPPIVLLNNLHSLLRPTKLGYGVQIA